MPSANPSSSAGAGQEFSISTDPAKLDVAWIVHSVLGSYWGSWLNSGQIRAALHESLVFGAYLPQTVKTDGGSIIESGERQIGFVRVLTDGAIFSSVCDVFTDEAHRNRGVGSALMRAVVEHPSVAGTICILAARPEAFDWYSKFGFVLIDRGSGIMQRQPK